MLILPSLRSRVAVCCAVFVLVAALVGNGSVYAQDADDTGRKKLDRLTVASGNSQHSFKVEIADTPAAQRKGLMHRDHLAKDRGMLFVFDKRRVRSFWMKNTNIALDMLFISKNGKIRHIHHDATPNSRKSISSRVPVRAVLEINGGLARQYGIEKGDIVHHATFK